MYFFVAVAVAVAIVGTAAVAANWRVIGCNAGINLLFYTRLPGATRRMSNVSAKKNVELLRFENYVNNNGSYCKRIRVIIRVIVIVIIRVTVNPLIPYP